jgi:5-methylcytosine-specific restriction endonuclease McrA
MGIFWPSGIEMPYKNKGIEKVNRRERHAERMANDPVYAERRREKDKRWYANNPEKTKEKSIKYREVNGKKLNAYSREYNAAHKEEIRERKRLYKEENPEKVSDVWRRYHEKNKEIRNRQSREYRANNTEKLAEYEREYYRKFPLLKRIKEQTRRSRMLGAFIERIDPAIVFERDKWVCQLCDGPVDRELKFPARGAAVVDHINPVSRGGLHEYVNVQLAHLSCNSIKNARPIRKLAELAA